MKQSTKQRDKNPLTVVCDGTKPRTFWQFFESGWLLLLGKQSSSSLQNSNNNKIGLFVFLYLFSHFCPLGDDV